MTNVYLAEFAVCRVMVVSCRTLTMGDQIALLKGATFEIMQIRFNMVFNTKTSIWECGHITYCIDDALQGETTHIDKNKHAFIVREHFP